MSLHVRRDAHDADAVVGGGGDQAGHLRAVAVVAKRDRVVVDVVARELRAAGEIGMLGVDAGVDDGDAHAGAAADVVRLGDVERADVRLQPRVRVVEPARRGASVADSNSLSGCAISTRLSVEQLLDDRLARGAGRNPEQHAVHLQLFDRPLGHQRERIVARQLADQRRCRWR